VFLNHYLDITDAISDGQNEMIDDTDLQGTDFPINVPLPQSMYVDDERHEQVREWILTNAMDRDVSQVGTRNTYALALVTRDVFAKQYYARKPNKCRLYFVVYATCSTLFVRRRRTIEHRRDV